MVLYISSAIFCLIGLMLQIDSVVSLNSFVAFYALGGSIFVIAIITQGSLYINQCVSVEKIEEYEANKKLYEEKAKVLIAECKEYLKDIYPNIEKEIFNNMSSAKALLLSFPEIKSHETITKLVDMINRNRTDVLVVDTTLTRIKREIRVRRSAAKFWVFAAMLPDYR